MKLLPKQFEFYKPNISFSIDGEHFLVKTAETKEELWGAFHLRHNVFYKERKNITLPSQISTDAFDIYGDHLIIIDKKDHQVVGTYRLTSSQRLKGIEHFGSKEFFNTSAFIDKVKDHNIVEMEWACTDKNIRASRSSHYIWLGLARYFRISFSKYLCGRVGLLKSSVKESASIYRAFLEQGLLDKSALVYPQKKYAVQDFDKTLAQALADKKYLSKIPRIFSWYLKMGAKVHGSPIFDPKASTYDFFMSLDFKNIQNPHLVNRYEDAVWLKNHLPD